MRNLCFSLALLCSIVSCGPKPSKTVSAITSDIDAFVTKIDANQKLKKETIEGALTDAKGFKDIGTFKYTVYFNDETKTLYKIKNVETTDTTISETYYFDRGNLVLIKADLEEGPQKLYVKKKKIISKNNTVPAIHKLLVDKAERFQKSYKQAH